jgi:hypothetical protein
VTTRAIAIERQRLKASTIGSLPMAGGARLATRLLRLDDVPVVIEIDADAGGGLRAHGGELRMARQAAELVARAALAIVHRLHHEFTAAMIDVTGRARDLFGAIGKPSIAAPHEHVRRLLHAIGSRRIVTPLAAQGFDSRSGGVALRTLQIDPRVMRRYIARRRDPALAGQIQER